MLYCNSLCNVVYYDGIDAYVSKFVLPTEGTQPTLDAIERVSKYLKGNGDVLKIDVLYPITLDNLVAMKGDKILNAVYDRFATMYFVV